MVSLSIGSWRLKLCGGRQSSYTLKTGFRGRNLLAYCSSSFLLIFGFIEGCLVVVGPFRWGFAGDEGDFGR